MMRPLRYCLAILSLLSATQVLADPADPVAVRRWPAGAISIETMWDLNLVIDTTGKASPELKATADQVVTFGEEIHHVLSRQPNADKVQWEPIAKGRKKQPNEVVVKSFRNEQAATGWAIQVMVDGISVLCVDIDSLPKDVTAAALSVTKQDVVIITANRLSTVNLPAAEPFLKAVSPVAVILNPILNSEKDGQTFMKMIADSRAATVSSHNTFAVAASSETKDSFQTHLLTDQPRAMPAELAALFERMETSCKASQKVFAELSINQMNWKPANGTHTPRWNTEHMMGRQLLFFSQIYGAIDPAIPALNLNPKQMPDDYQYAHQDWTGAEEARQMQRVSKFTRRFAYLMHDLNVNQRAPGSRWPSLKALLLQMERHYSEHTANTVKKFDLSDWPNE